MIIKNEQIETCSNHPEDNSSQRIVHIGEHECIKSTFNLNGFGGIKNEIYVIISMRNMFYPVNTGRITNKIEHNIKFEKPDTLKWIVPDYAKSVDVLLTRVKNAPSGAMNINSIIKN